MAELSQVINKLTVDEITELSNQVNETKNDIISLKKTLEVYPEIFEKLYNDRMTELLKVAQTLSAYQAFVEKTLQKDDEPLKTELSNIKEQINNIKFPEINLDSIQSEIASIKEQVNNIKLPAINLDSIRSDIKDEIKEFRKKTFQKNSVNIGWLIGGVVLTSLATGFIFTIVLKVML